MKTKIFTLMICCLGMFLGNKAKAEDNISESVNIEKYISYPEEAKADNLNDKVSVSFQVDETGKVEVKTVESQYEIFSSSVKEQLSNLVLEQLDTSKIYRMILHFNLL